LLLHSHFNLGEAILGLCCFCCSFGVLGGAGSVRVCFFSSPSRVIGSRVLAAFGPLTAKLGARGIAGRVLTTGNSCVNIFWSPACFGGRGGACVFVLGSVIVMGGCWDFLGGCYLVDSNVIFVLKLGFYHGRGPTRTYVELSSFYGICYVMFPTVSVLREVRKV